MVVEYQAQGRMATITLNRPEVRNAVNVEVIEAVEDAIDRMEADDDVWLGILAGSGPVFCAGVDLMAVAAGERDLGPAFGRLVSRRRDKPLIAAVDGAAVAGGCELVLACDLVVASTNATFGLPEVKRCLVAMAGGTSRLPQRLPPNLAMEMALTGDAITAERAYHFGLVNTLCEPGEVMAKALELAERVNANAPLAVRATRKAVIEGVHLDVDDGIRVTTDLFRSVARSEDFKEGPRAFVEKRPAIWQAR